MFLFNEEAIFGKEIEILKEDYSRTSSKYGPKVKFRTLLQTGDEVNGNKRIYQSALLKKGIESITPMVHANYLVGEMDHPLMSGNPKTDVVRHHIVLYEKASHFFKKVFMDGNTVIGELETTSTQPHGYNLAGLILDGVIVGFSLRGTGDQRPAPGGAIYVTDPFKMITYDSVSNPSHAKARMTEVMTENFKFDDLESEDIATLREGAIFDRTDLLVDVACNNILREIGSNREETYVKNLSESISQKDHSRSEKIIYSMIESHLREDFTSFDVIAFLQEYIEGKSRVESLFEKHLKS